MIDTEHLCPKCMNEWADPTRPCPCCGFCGVDEFTGESWEDFTIVEGRYLVGTAISQNDEGITYIAMDLAEEKVVTLRPTAEGFAVGDYTPVQPEPEASTTGCEKKRNILVPVLCAVGAVAICVFLAVHFGLFGGHNAGTTPEADVYYDLANYGTIQEDGSVWLLTEEQYAICDVFHNEDGSVSAGQWEVSSLESYSYEFEDNGEATITYNHHSEYYDNTYQFEYSADGMLCRTAVISSEGDQQVTEYDHQGDRVNISYYHNGEQTGVGTVTAEDGKLLRMETRSYEPGDDSYYEQVSVYTYREDGSYMVETTETISEGTRTATTEYDKDGKRILSEEFHTDEDGDDYSSTTYEYDDAGNMLQQDTYEFDAVGGETYSCVTYDYDDQGNVTRWIQTTSDSDGQMLSRYEYRYEYSGGLLSRERCIYDDGTIEITEYEYDEFGNRLTEYSYLDTATGNWLRNQSFTCSTYEKYILQNGVYVATGETSGTLDATPPTPHIPTIIAENSDENEKASSETGNEADSDITELLPDEGESWELIDLLSEYGFVGDSVKYCFEYEEAEIVWKALKAGAIDYITDVTAYIGEGFEHWVVLPPDDVAGEYFPAIFCVDEDVLWDITEILYDNGYYDPDSDAYAFLTTLFSTVDAVEGVWRCGTENYTQFRIYTQYMELWAGYGATYELTYFPTGEVRTGG